MNSRVVKFSRLYVNLSWSLSSHDLVCRLVRAEWSRTKCTNNKCFPRFIETYRAKCSNSQCVRCSKSTAKCIPRTKNSMQSAQSTRDTLREVREVHKVREVREVREVLKQQVYSSR